MRSLDGEGSAKILALCESVAEGHRLAAQLCVSDLQLTLTALDLARHSGSAARFQCAVRDGERALRTMRSVLTRLKLTPPEEARIHDLMAVLQASIAPDGSA
jgi:hypothetical protein